MTAWGGRLENPVSDRLRNPATTGYVALALGAFAAFLAIPPIEARSPLWPIAVGIVAIALGIWTATRGRRKLGWGAVVVGLLGIGLGIYFAYSQRHSTIATHLGEELKFGGASPAGRAIE